MTQTVSSQSRGTGQRPKLVSSGFATVDAMAQGHLRAAPGGTAFNVARALRSFGWSTAFVGTVGDDPAGRFLKGEAGDAGIDVEWLELDPTWTTPVIVQEELRGDHVWRFKCPICGAPFAKHRPAATSVALEVLRDSDIPDVFFFDRATLFTLTLAERWSLEGSFIMFEPAGRGRPQLFERAVAVADLIKFSSERGAAFTDLIAERQALTIETRGDRGARFRLPAKTSWHNLAAEILPILVDSAGAGDWTSAGILNYLVESRGAGKKLNLESANAALRAGQHEGALACGWEGVHPGALRQIEGGDFESFGCPRVLSLTRPKRKAS
jgi:fructokinase